jgi:hypothetical protein
MNTITINKAPLYLIIAGSVLIYALSISAVYFNANKAPTVSEVVSLYINNKLNADDLDARHSYRDENFIESPCPKVIDAVVDNIAGRDDIKGLITGEKGINYKGVSVSKIDGTLTYTGGGFKFLPGSTFFGNDLSWTCEFNPITNSMESFKLEATSPLFPPIVATEEELNRYNLDWQAANPTSTRNYIQ